MRPVIDFSLLKLNSKEPVYLQIVQFIKRRILLKAALDGDELPSRRDLALMLDINPNTVQKAFRQMEDEGFVTTGSNVRSQLLINEGIIRKFEDELTVTMIKDFIRSAREVNLPLERVIQMIEEMWKQE